MKFLKIFNQFLKNLNSYSLKFFKIDKVLSNKPAILKNYTSKFSKPTRNSFLFPINNTSDCQIESCVGLKNAFSTKQFSKRDNKKIRIIEIFLFIKNWSPTSYRKLYGNDKYDGKKLSLIWSHQNKKVIIARLVREMKSIKKSPVNRKETLFLSVNLNIYYFFSRFLFLLNPHYIIVIIVICR